MGSKSKTESVKEPKVKWVKSWRDIPSSHPDIDPTDAQTVARYNPNKNVIYAIEDKTSASDLEHEKYHAMRNQIHGHQHKERASDYIAEELNASKYAYDKTGDPKRMLSILRGIVKELAKGKQFESNVKPSRALRIIEEQLLRIDPPQGWANDYKKLVGQAHEAWRKGRDNPRSLFYGDAEPKVSPRFQSKASVTKDKSLLRDKKPWWEDGYYNNDSLVRGKRLGRRIIYCGLLPPDLGCKI